MGAVHNVTLVITILRIACPEKLKRKGGRRRRRPVIENRTEYVTRARRLRRDDMRIQHNGLKAGATRRRLGEASSLAVQVLPFGFAGSAVSGLYGMTLRRDGNGETSGKAQRQ